MFNLKRVCIEDLNGINHITIKVKLFDDHSIKYSVSMAGVDPVWQDGVCDNKAAVCKQIIDDIEKNKSDVNSINPLWKTKILDTIITASFPEYIKRNCMNCKFFYQDLNGENCRCERFDESLAGCDITGECGCDFWENFEY